MGHAEVAEAPGHGGENGQEPERALPLLGHGGEAQVLGDAFGVGHDVAQPSGVREAEADDREEGHGHEDGLEIVRDAGSEEAPKSRVQHDDGRGEEHGLAILQPEEGGKELAAGHEAGSRVGHEEDDDDDRRQSGEDVFIVPEAAGEEVGDGDGAREHRIPAEPPGHDEPVEVGADGEAQGRPEGLRRAAEKGQARHAHEEPARHVAGLRGHGRDEGAQGTPAQEEGVGAPARPAAVVDPHADDQRQICHDGEQHHPFVRLHLYLPCMKLVHAVFLYGCSIERRRLGIKPEIAHFLLISPYFPCILYETEIQPYYL